MEYLVESSEGIILGAVQAKDATEAWEEARRVYGPTGALILDVKLSPKESEVYREMRTRKYHEKKERREYIDSMSDAELKQFIIDKIDILMPVPSYEEYQPGQGKTLSRMTLESLAGYILGWPKAITGEEI